MLPISNQPTPTPLPSADSRPGDAVLCPACGEPIIVALRSKADRLAYQAQLRRVTDSTATWLHTVADRIATGYKTGAWDRAA